MTEVATRPSPSSAPPVSSSDSVLRHSYLQALGEPIPRSIPSPLYLFQLVATAVLMLLLPVLYVGLIGVVAYLTYWHTVNDISIFGTVRGTGSGGAKLAALVYITPIIAGGCLVLFMIKPFFAPRSAREVYQALTRKDEPLLFAFVDKLCDNVGAPRPSEIHIDMDLNASARFNGLFSGVLGGNLILTIGLPLAAGLSLQQFTGVLAHEFGHFAQRSAMRLSYVIRSINMWFARVVYQRDGWDEALDNALSDGGHYAINIIAGLCKLMVYLSRRILWVLMMTGHLFSSLLMRQMEYDADRYSARAVGTNATQEMLRSLPALSLAMNATYSQLTQSLAEKRLPDSVPELVAYRVRDLTPDLRTKLAEITAKEKTGWFDSHPVTTDRVKALSRRTEPGFFQASDASTTSAAALFTNFPTLSRLMTQQFYRDVLGGRASNVELVKVDTIEAAHQAKSEQAKSLTTYLADLPNPLRPYFFGAVPSPDPAVDPSIHADELFSLRTAFLDALPAACKAAKTWEELDDKLTNVECLAAFTQAGLKNIPSKELGMRSGDLTAIAQTRTRFTNAADDAREQINKALAIGFRRILLALLLDPATKPAQPVQDTEPDRNDYDLRETPSHAPASSVAQKLLPVFFALEDATFNIREIRTLFTQQRALLELAERHGRDEHYAHSVISTNRKLFTLVTNLTQATRGTEYPYSPGGKSLSLSSYLVEFPGSPDDIGQTMNAAAGALSKAFNLYMRALADLAARAEQIEAELGLPPLELPPIDPPTNP